MTRDTLGLDACAGGVVPPICTPLLDSGEVDVASLDKHIRRLVEAGVKGVFALGSTGEAPYLNNADRSLVVREADRVLRTFDIPLLVGLVEPTTSRVIEAYWRLRRALSAAPAAVVVTAPFYASVSDSEILRHFELVAQAVDVPVLAYNIPVNVGFEIRPELLIRMLEIGVIAGVKDSTPQLGTMRAVATAGAGAGWRLFSGSDVLLDCALQVGANGSVAGLANVVPELFVSAIDAFLAQDAASLAILQARIGTVARLYHPTDPAVGRNSTELGSIKSALWILGHIESDQVREPMTRSSAARREFVREVLVAAGLA